MSCRRVEIHVVPTPGARMKGSAVIIFIRSYARHACNTKTTSFARKFITVNINSEADCTSSAEQCGPDRGNGPAESLRSARFSAVMVAVSGSATEPMKERTDNVDVKVFCLCNLT